MVDQRSRDVTPRFERGFELDVVDPIADLANPQQEWRRLAAEFSGTFLLVLVAAARVRAVRYGGGRSGSEAAQGVFNTEVIRPDRT